MLGMAMSGRAATEDANGICEGWPENYGGVMLQGFWWDSYSETTWAKLTDKANELSQYFDLIWVPNSGTVSGDPDATSQGTSMGYDPCFWLRHNSCFGTEEELRTMIQTYKSKGVGIIEDVVINHKKGQHDWLDFPNETVEGTNTGKTYEIAWTGEPDYSEITCNDDCNYQGYTTHGGYDTGDDFPGFRDLDHTSAVTQANVKTYLDYLLNELGYAGFRYDLVKGYAAGYIQTYNNSAMPRFSVGEYWDSQTNIQNWIMGTGNTSAAFDFPLKYKLNEAISGGDYSALAWKSFSFDPNFSRYAVTFADNHDTGRESSKLQYNWTAANAFLLASPGTPCIWFPHYKADPVNIQKMIMARKACGITNTWCNVEEQYATDGNSGYWMKSAGSKGSVLVLLGQAATSQTGNVPASYTLVAEGDAYKFYSTVNNFASVTVSPGSKKFTSETLDVTLTPVNATKGAWYKIGEDGTPATLSDATTVTLGEGLYPNSAITLYWGATGDDNTEHTGTATFTKHTAYNEPALESSDEVSVFLETDATSATIWAWDGDNNYTGGNWDTKPAMELQGLNEATGRLVYKWTCTEPGMPTKLLFVTSNKQTADFSFVNHGYYTEEGLSYHLGTNTVYFDNAVSQWSDVYYYAWDKAGKCKTEWPGEKIDATNAQGLYEVTLDGKYTSIIFNNPDATGVKQTADLAVVDGETYRLEANTVYFDNTNSRWSKVYYYTYTDDEVQKSRWPGEEIASPNAQGLYEVTLPTIYTKIIFNSGSENGIVGFNQTGNLTVTDGQTYSLDVPTYTVAGSAALMGGNGWDPTDTGNDMTVGDDGTYCYLTRQAYLKAGNYEFKVVVNHNWNNASYPSEKNYVINIGADGLYEVSFYFHPADHSVTHRVDGITELVVKEGEAFAAASEFTAAKASYHRDFKNNWGTLCLPFKIKNTYEGVTFYQLSEVDPDAKVLTFAPVTSVGAGVPVVFKAADGVALDIVETDVAVVAQPGTDSSVTGWTLHGTFQQLSSYNASENFYLYYIAGNQFWQGTDTNIAPYRAYFITTADLGDAEMQQAPFRIAVDEEQGIRMVEQEDGTVKACYDLTGRRLGEDRNGLVIENGKLIFVK